MEFLILTARGYSRKHFGWQWHPKQLVTALVVLEHSDAAKGGLERWFIYDFCLYDFWKLSWLALFYIKI